MSRFTDFSSALERELALPYEYGQSDCFFLALGVWDAVTGGKRRKQYKGRYKTLKGAQRALRKEGHKSLVSFFEADLEQIPPAMAVMGDIAVVETINDQSAVGDAAAVCVGNGFIAKHIDGQARYDFGAVKAAFRVT